MIVVVIIIICFTPCISSTNIIISIIPITNATTQRFNSNVLGDQCQPRLLESLGLCAAHKLTFLKFTVKGV